MNLTDQLEVARRARIAGAIKVAVRMIQACPDEQKRWRACHELRKLQRML